MGHNKSDYCNSVAEQNCLVDYVHVQHDNEYTITHIRKHQKCIKETCNNTKNQICTT